MRKEPIIAIFVGALFGVLVAFFAWRASIAKNNTETSQPSNIKQNQTDSQSDTDPMHSFDIVNPQDNSVSLKQNVEVNGFSSQDSIIGVITPTDSALVQSQNGQFSTQVDIDGGVNQIFVYEFSGSSSPDLKSTTVTYSSQLEAPEGEEAKLYSSIFGAVTDIAEDTIQLRTTSGEIEQISINDNTTYVNIVNDAKDIEFTDVAIGDYIVAIGVKNGNDVMEVARVLVSKEQEATNYVGIMGTIDTLSSRDFIVTGIDGTKYSVDATGSVNVVTKSEDGSLVKTKLTTAKEGDNIVILGRMDKELEAEHIYLP